MTSQMMPPEPHQVEEPTKFSAPSGDYQGPENAPPSFEEPQEDSQGVEQEILESLNEVPDDMKELLALYMTPEFADIMGMFLGEPYRNVFMQLADPTKILVPLDRDKAPGLQPTGQEAAAQNEGATPPQTEMDTPPTATS